MAEKETQADRIAAKRATLQAQDQSLASAEDIARINDLIIALSESPERARRYNANPDEVLREAGIKGPLAELVRSGSRYAAMLAAPPRAGLAPIVVVVVVVVNGLIIRGKGEGGDAGGVSDTAATVE